MLGFLRDLAAGRIWSENSIRSRSKRRSENKRPRSVTLGVEQLEDRWTPSFANVSAHEQLLIELINRARLDPVAEAARYGIDLNQGLTPGSISTAAKAPLAPHQALINAAGLHSDDMYVRNYFSHTNLQGLNSWNRAINQGYPTSYVGENIAWGTYNAIVHSQEQAVLERHRQLFLSAGHRQNLLNPTYNEVGTGVTFGVTPYQSITVSGLNVSIVTENFGWRNGVVYLTGVAFTDSIVRDNFYTVGEGLGGVTITATNQFGQSFTTTTAFAGGYALPLAAGTYTVRASGGGLAQPITVSGVTISSANVKLDFVPGQSSGNQPPQMLAIPDQLAERGQTVFVALNASDPDGDAISYQVSISSGSPLYNLDQELKLVQQSGTYHQNWLGRNEKWVFSQANNQWYFVTPDGRFFRWTGGTFQQSVLVTTLDASVHADPGLLHEARPPQAAPVVSTSISGNLMSVKPPAGFAGSFKVTVTASDGKDFVSRFFMVTVKNHAPQLNAIADQTMSRNQDTLTLTLQASDADGDPLSYSAMISAYSKEFKWNQELKLVQQGGTYYQNWLGQNEKWVFSQARNQWYFVTPDGRFFRWTGGTFQQSVLVDTVNPACHANPALLHNAQMPLAPAVSATFVGNRLTLRPPTGFVGSFQVTVNVSDGHVSTSKSFVVHVINRAPQLAPIADRTMTRTQGSLQVTLNASDADGDNLTFYASIQAVNLLYDLNQQLQLYKSGNTFFENWLGLGEKWLHSNADGRWYFILGNGRLYRWGGAGLNTSTLITTLDASVHANPALLYQAQLPTAPAVSAFFNGNILTLFPPAGFTGSFRIQVTASDGIAHAAQSFLVRVS